MTSGRSYSLVSRDTTGVFLGLGVAECVLIGVGFALTIVLHLVAMPVVVSALPLLVAAIAAKVQVSGQPLHQWLALLTAWAAKSVRGLRRWRGGLPLLPMQGDESVDVPPVLRGVDVVEIPHGIRRFAAVRDRKAARLTVIVPVRAQRFVGADASTQDTLLSAWGEVVATHAAVGSPVVQIGWSHQAVPSRVDGHRAWLDALDHETSERTYEREQYDVLVDEVASSADEHETVVWLTVSGRDLAGKGKLLDRAVAALPAAVETLVGCLGDAGVEVGDPLSVLDLWRTLRRRGDPGERPVADVGLSLAERMGLVGAPLAVDAAWNEVHVDGAWHRVYWIETWPRRPVPADWLSGFLASADSTTTTVIHRPLDRARSHRRIDSQLVKFQAHRARKEDKGRRVTETDERTEQAVHELEADLASGFAETLYLGLVCVTATSLEELDARCQAVEQSARAAQMGLRLLHGRQDVAWAATLPFGLTEPGLLELVGP